MLAPQRVGTPPPPSTHPRPARADPLAASPIISNRIVCNFVLLLFILYFVFYIHRAVNYDKTFYTQTCTEKWIQFFRFSFFSLGTRCSFQPGQDRSSEQQVLETILPMARLGTGVKLTDGRTAALLGEYPKMWNVPAGQAGGTGGVGGNAVSESGAAEGY